MSQPSGCATVSPTKRPQKGGFDTSAFSVLLDDPEIARWANETGLRYRISCLEALGVLAHALVVDARR
jgi:hypothetical protein